MHSRIRDIRYRKRDLRHLVGYAELSHIPESDMPDTTVIGTSNSMKITVLYAKFSLKYGNKHKAAVCVLERIAAFVMLM